MILEYLGVAIQPIGHIFVVLFAEPDEKLCQAGYDPWAIVWIALD